jgi:hypothetical protein
MDLSAVSMTTSVMKVHIASRRASANFVDDCPAACRRNVPGSISIVPLYRDLVNCGGSTHHQERLFVRVADYVDAGLIGSPNEQEAHLGRHHADRHHAAGKQVDDRCRAFE